MSKKTRKTNAKATATKKKAIEKTPASQGKSQAASPPKAVAREQPEPLARTVEPGDIILSSHRYSVVHEVLGDTVSATYVDLIERAIQSMQERIVPIKFITAVYRKVEG